MTNKRIETMFGALMARMDAIEGKAAKAVPTPKAEAKAKPVAKDGSFAADPAKVRAYLIGEAPKPVLALRSVVGFHGEGYSPVAGSDRKWPSLVTLKVKKDKVATAAQVAKLQAYLSK